jgi:hypothetical protein
MSGMTDQEARQWCERNDIALRDGEPVTSRLGSGIYFSIPDQSAARIQLSRVLYPSTFDVTGTVLIWTKEWGVWPSSEHMPLFTRFRQALGEPRPLSGANAQQFEGAQAEDGESLLILNCLFLWDCWLIAERGTYVLHFSHDEWGQLFAEPAILDRARKYLTQRGLIS